ncbi:MAG: hypothetical protein R3A47_07765 [Polyangiales bacterium]
MTKFLGSRIAMVQAFLPDVTTGDKRILLLEGELIGAFWCVPQGGDVRSKYSCWWIGGRYRTHCGGLRDHRTRGAQYEDGLFFVVSM